MVTRSPCHRCFPFLSGFLLVLVVVFLQEGGKDVSTTVEAFSSLHVFSSRPSSFLHQRSSSCHHSAGSAATATIIMPIIRPSGVGSSTKCAASISSSSSSSSRTTKITSRLLAKSSDKDDEEEMGITGPGMKDAFRQLDALESIGSDDDDSNDKGSSSSSSSSTSKPTTSRISPIQPLQESAMPLVPVAAEAALPPLEKQVQMYTDMVKELEEQDQDDLYSDVLADMGVDPNTIITASTKSKSTSSSSSSLNDNNNSPSSFLDTDTEKFMNQALQEALQEAAAAASANKGNKANMADSVLNNKEIMKEIEQIFERGNDQLMETIEEMRAEQRELAKASAEDTAQSAMDNIDVNAQRLARAESSMVAMLQRVNKETAAVEKAVQDLQQAQMDMSSKNAQSPISKLRQGGIPKQAALAGLLLFSFRSIADSLAAMGSGSGGDGDMTAALIQGAIALACGVYLILF